MRQPLLKVHAVDACKRHHPAHAPQRQLLMPSSLRESGCDKRESGVQGFNEIGSQEWDGVIDRDYIKHRSQKVTAKRDHGNKSRPTTASGKKHAS